MNEIKPYTEILTAICTCISVIIAVTAFIRQQNIQKLQNLVSIFQRFSNNDDFLRIFELCDYCYVRLESKATLGELDSALEQLSNYPAAKKYQFLALLEEVALYAHNSAFMEKNAVHLFRFHFKFIYNETRIADAFWHNVGSGPTERKKSGWHYQSRFASHCV